MPSLPDDDKLIEVSIVIPDDPVEPAGMTIGALANYLWLFDRTYTAIKRGGRRVPISALYDFGTDSQIDAPPDLQEIISNTWEYLPLSTSGPRYQPSSELSFEYYYSLDVVRITKSSPAEIVAVAIPSILAIAVIFSGGHIKMPFFECYLPPLGEGIRALRYALGFWHQRGGHEPRLKKEQIRIEQPPGPQP